MTPGILLIEDDPDIAELIRYHLEREGFAIAWAPDGEQGLRMLGERLPDAILLDLMLPGTGGLEVCKAVRSDPKTAALPILILSAKGEETDVVLGLELGADDYLVKPFSPRVLVARAKALLRRTEGSGREPSGKEGALRRGPLVIDRTHHEVALAGKPVALTLTEFRLLYALAARPGRVFTRGQLIDACRGSDAAVLDRTIDVHVNALRHKLGKSGDALETVRGVGYRFRKDRIEP